MRNLVSVLALLCALAASSVAQLNWTRHPNNPVLHASSSNRYDPTRISWAFRSSIIYDDSRGAYMGWLAAWVGGNPAFDYSFSHATSFDGANWYYYSKNPVITPSVSGFDIILEHTAVLKDAGGYKMYYSGEPQGWSNRIGLATSSNGIQWQKYGGNPILVPGPSGSWDSQNIMFANVHRVGTTYYLWYSGSGPDLRHRIGLATSTDGIVWTKHPSNPVLGQGGSGTWDSETLGETNVVLINGVFYMVYTAIGNSGIQSIGLATSLDGINWQKYSGNPIFTPQGGWEGSRVANSSVIFRGNKFHMWYSGHNQSWQTGYATADLEYIPNQTQPNILRNGSFETGTSPWAHYTNGSGSFAVITGGTDGTKAARVTVTNPGSNVQLNQVGFSLEPNTLYRLTFDAYSSTGNDLSVFVHRNTSPYTNYGVNNFIADLSTGWQRYTLIFTSGGFAARTTDTRLRFWFPGFAQAGDHYFIDNISISAVSPGPGLTSGGEGGQSADLPTEAYLKQNYPNPFNPETTIEFGLPEDASVKLEVFNTLGQSVATLVDGSMRGGSHRVPFSGTDLPSGTYFYRLAMSNGSAMPSVHHGKMVLLK